MCIVVLGLCVVVVAVVGRCVFVSSSCVSVCLCV